MLFITQRFQAWNISTSQSFAFDPIQDRTGSFYTCKAMFSADACEIDIARFSHVKKAEKFCELMLAETLERINLHEAELNERGSFAANLPLKDLIATVLRKEKLGEFCETILCD